MNKIKPELHGRLRCSLWLDLPRVLHSFSVEAVTTTERIHQAMIYIFTHIHISQHITVYLCICVSVYIHIGAQRHRARETMTCVEACAFMSTCVYI